MFIDSKDNPQLFKVIFKQSTTDPFHIGIDLFHLWATVQPYTQWKVFFHTLPYVATTREHSSSWKIGISHTPKLNTLDSLLTKSHINNWKCNAHSFHIRAATTARQADILDTLIQLILPVHSIWQSFHKSLSNTPSDSNGQDFLTNSIYVWVERLLKTFSMATRKNLKNTTALLRPNELPLTKHWTYVCDRG